MTAFKAAFSDMKLVKTRGVTQLIFEIQTEEFDAAYEILGGVPLAGKERWFGIAAINLPQAEKEKSNHSVSAPVATLQPENPKPSAGVKRDWRDLQPAAQAGIRCAEPIFVAFLNETRGYRITGADEAAEAVREICGVKSRVELGTKHAARAIWHQLDTAYLAWKAMECA